MKIRDASFLLQSCRYYEKETPDSIVLGFDVLNDPDVVGVYRLDFLLDGEPAYKMIVVRKRDLEVLGRLPREIPKP